MQIVGRPATPTENMIRGIGQVPRVIVPERTEIVEFKGNRQLRGGLENGTFERIMFYEIS